MQVNAVKPINFRSNEIIYLPAPSSDEERSAGLNRRPSEFHSEEEALSKMHKEDKLREYIDTVRRADNNVRFATVATSALLFIGAITKGNKIAKPIMNTVLIAGRTVANGVVGAAGKLIKKINVESVKGKIAAKVENLINGAPNEKMLSGISNFVDGVFTKGSGDISNGAKVVGIMKKLGIQNFTDLVRNIAVGGIAVGVADKAADKVEGVLDEKEIKRAKDKLINDGINTAVELVGSVL